MRFVQFVEQGQADAKPRFGVQVSDGGDIVDVTATDKTIPATTLDVLRGGDAVIERVRAAVESKANVIKAADAVIKAPIYDCEKVICIGMNYVDHCTEQNLPVPKEPLVFSKFASSIADPGADIIKAPVVEKLDFEVELAVVIGKEAHRVKAAEAMEYVAGYTVAHDVSARDWQLEKNGGQWLIGKTFDTFAPIGPAIVTRDDLADPHNLGIRCRVNGETMQDSNTNQLVFKTETIIEWITQFVTLKPGDIILTGTPPGVGCFRKPPVWLKDGDVVEVEIDSIGCISNTVREK
ncbi:fumarylacetoacetate hydrolase domain-containing protein 2B [Salpingoeca rosetta]|uniref:Fumarylacetoacetate hydrolase domain-containing protein 2B n=1 Tax=Salpingoeca rosetta (strain ATCC 50818 / BSB-021) TaxID=946362 RepID=F2U773_SALR5|nr:fumarylacetoacetate hydrolase domain-containing protein 2B [Salpingoeca rosetta]EGD83290.1 fumarylacetoacetate hydrolase domain-containing protein 2B [Salpingoeca rosetta]|eukprot:XP_004994794.1 fumarylacetoacetate hydrolase domain-containing protein 2B [Salpingoeca rosetta]